MNQPVTVVLPIHNQERPLPSLVWGILDLADSLSMEVRVMLIDDASTDDTFDAACELSKSVPQVQIMRQSTRQGFKAALDRVRRETGLTTAIVHDGASPIELRELAALLKEASVDGPSSKRVDREASDDGNRGSRRFASLASLHARMQQAHGAITSFRWMQVHEPQLPPRRMRDALSPIGPPTSQTPSVRKPLSERT